MRYLRFLDTDVRYSEKGVALKDLSLVLGMAEQYGAKIARQYKLQVTMAPPPLGRGRPMQLLDIPQLEAFMLTVLSHKTQAHDCYRRWTYVDQWVSIYLIPALKNCLKEFEAKTPKATYVDTLIYNRRTNTIKVILEDNRHHLIHVNELFHGR